MTQPDSLQTRGRGAAIALGLAAALCALAATKGLAAGPGSDAQGTEYRFGVYYDERRIGEHRWQITRQSGLTRVASRARFDVKVLFVPVYRYRHAANELWQDDCLATVAAVTDDNGRLQRVSGARQPAPQLTGFANADADASRRVALADDCAGSFAYWDLALLDRPALLNVQSGETMPATLTRQGQSVFQGETAIRYQLEAGDLPKIELWYRPDDLAWLGLSTERDGATLSYRLEARAPLAPTALDPRDALPAPSI